MGSRSTRGRNEGVPPGKWYGALRQQVHGRWIAYVYDLNGMVTIWHSCFNTAGEAKDALDLRARALRGNPTDVNFSGPAAAPPPMSGAALESWQREGGAGYSHSGYMPWQSGGKRETQGPEYIFWQGGEEDPQFPDFHYWEHGNGRSC